MNSAYLFDIDGTLLNVDSSFIKPLIEEILKVFSIDPDIVNRIDYAGHTDASIFRRLLGKHQEDDELFENIKRVYIERMDQFLTPEDVNVFVGAAESVEYLHQKNQYLGLLTGNFRETARIKLRAAGLNHFFEFGAYGCQHTNRNFLPADAEKAFQQHTGIALENRKFIIIGDTPHDIRCARYFGAISVAVTTGHYTFTELSEHNPDLTLESLRYPEKWLQNLPD
jgi:phosphoglycolate phosphatase